MTNVNWLHIVKLNAVASKPPINVDTKKLAMYWMKTCFTCQWWLGVLIAICLTACAPESIQRSVQVADQLKKEGRLFSHQLVQVSSSLHYMATCDIRPLAGSDLRCEQHPTVKRVLVFFHGTPGDWTSFSPQLADRQWGSDSLLVSIDRPGWGQSALDSERIEPSLARQAQDIAPLLLQLKRQFEGARVYLVGHSLGATLVPIIALEVPELVDGVVAIAGDLSTQAFSPRWYNHIANFPVIRAILPREMCFANEEVLALTDNLQQMEVNWDKLLSPMLVLQGERDGLVDPRNALLAKDKPPPGGVTVIMYPELGHLMHLVEVEKVNAEIKKWIDGQEQGDSQ
ncbi:MAG: alpha/beta hydrolase [Cellvibrionaceae bacterium]|nr:alpha/beta hydrolase [Cellvibrionaceae bacterium]